MDLADPITPHADPADPLSIEREQWLSRLATLNRASVADTLAHVGAFADFAQVAGQLLATSAPGSSEDDSDGPRLSAQQQRALAVGVAASAALLNDRLGGLLLSGGSAT